MLPSMDSTDQGDCDQMEMYKNCQVTIHYNITLLEVSVLMFIHTNTCILLHRDPLERFPEKLVLTTMEGPTEFNNINIDCLFFLPLFIFSL